MRTEFAARAALAADVHASFTRQIERIANPLAVAVGELHGRRPLHYGDYLSRFDKNTPLYKVALGVIADVIQGGPEKTRVYSAIRQRIDEARLAFQAAVPKAGNVSYQQLAAINDSLVQGLFDLDLALRPAFHHMPTREAASSDPRMIALGRQTWAGWLVPEVIPEGDSFGEAKRGEMPAQVFPRAKPGDLPPVMYRGVRRPDRTLNAVDAVHAANAFAAAKEGIGLAFPRYKLERPDHPHTTDSFWTSSLAEAVIYAGPRGRVISVETAGIESGFSIMPRSETSGTSPADIEARFFGSTIGNRVKVPRKLRA